MKSILLIALLCVGGAAVQDMPKPTRTEQHEWLAQLVGEWTVSVEATMEPGAEPMRMESSETVRSIGGLWVVAEGSTTFDGEPFASMLTLGYDPVRKAFVGSWIDTTQAYMWSYVGTLDESGRILTLETAGPAFDDPGATANYRDALEIKGPDHRQLTSSVQQADGSWVGFMRADYRRKD
jgi:hypothetical protein